MMDSNKSTTILGWIFTIAIAIYGNPTTLEFLPEGWSKYLHGFSGLIVVIAGGFFASSAKNKNVTGGSVPATEEAEERLLNQRAKIELSE